MVVEYYFVHRNEFRLVDNLPSSISVRSCWQRDNNGKLAPVVNNTSVQGSRIRSLRLILDFGSTTITPMGWYNDNRRYS